MSRSKIKTRSLYGEKYKDNFFVEKYVALWAYGYRNGIGQSEGLYRTINELGFDCLEKGGYYHILDVGCGVGRTAADYAEFFINADVIGIDDAELMIAMAHRINKTGEKINLDMRKLGFKTSSIEGKIIRNVNFYKTSLAHFYKVSPKGNFDLVTAVNCMDRIPDVRQSFITIHSLLKTGGIFIFATPLNFSNVQDWDKYGSFESLARLAQQTGFAIEVKFDGLIYKEILDARGATEEYQTAVMKLVKRWTTR